LIASVVATASIAATASTASIASMASIYLSCAFAVETRCLRRCSSAAFGVCLTAFHCTASPHQTAQP
jgi:hypothetical protein